MTSEFSAMKNNNEKQDLQEQPDRKIIKLSKEAIAKIRTNLAIPLPIDKFSSMGRFGWSKIGKDHIPYLIRSEENYCSVRMLEIKVFNKWIRWFCQELYNCTNIASYYVTESEARLLNEIAFHHCNFQFGRKKFSTHDLVIRLADASEFYNFLRHCFDKLANKTQTDTTNRFGFISINKEFVVPFIVKNDQRYVPLILFEGLDIPRDVFTPRAEKVEGWDLSYLKFCFKVEGVTDELHDDYYSVVCLKDIKNCFPPGTVFEDYWPEESTFKILSGHERSLPGNVQWYKTPVAPPPKPATQSRAATTPNSERIAVNSRVAGSQPDSNITADSSLSKNNPSISTIEMTTASRANRNILMAAAPSTAPPLCRIGTAIPDQVQTNSICNQNPVHQVDAMAQLLQPSTSYNYGVNITTQNQNNTANEKIPILILRRQTPDTSMPDTRPYKLRICNAEGKIFTGINSKPHVFTDCWVTLQDLVNNLFIGTSAQKIEQLLRVLSIEVHKATEDQRLVLMEQGKCEKVTGDVALVDLKHVLRSMSPLKYMLINEAMPIVKEEPKQ